MCTSMSGLWGPQTALDLYLQQEGITTLFFAGVNADQVGVHTRKPKDFLKFTSGHI